MGSSHRISKAGIWISGCQNCDNKAGSKATESGNVLRVILGTRKAYGEFQSVYWQQKTHPICILIHYLLWAALSHCENGGKHFLNIWAWMSRLLRLLVSSGTDGVSMKWWASKLLACKSYDCAFATFRFGGKKVLLRAPKCIPASVGYISWGIFPFAAIIALVCCRKL